MLSYFQTLTAYILYRYDITKDLAFPIIFIGFYPNCFYMQNLSLFIMKRLQSKNPLKTKGYKKQGKR
jgi:hypothetical protein